MDQDNKFKCDICMKEFKWKSILYLHMTQCKVNTKLKNDPTISQATEVKEEENLYKCDQCEKTYNNSHTLQNHMNFSHKEKKLRCEKCSKMFSFKYYLKRHLKGCNEKEKNKLKDVAYKKVCNTEGKQEFKCLECNKMLATVQSIHSHISYVHKVKERNHICSKCEKQFLFPYFLKRHLAKCDGIVRTKKTDVMNVEQDKIINNKANEKDIKYFTNENLDKKYQCNICDKIFKCYSTFHQHNSFYHKEKKFKCEMCEKRFPFKSILIKHMEVCCVTKPRYQSKDNVYLKEDNLSDKKYKCKICERIFSTKSLILQHIQCNHTEKRFKCEKCGKEYPFKSIFKKHMKVCMKKGLKDKKFLKDIDYKVIIHGKIYQCNKCEKSFSGLSFIRKHIFNVHEEKKVKCEHCDKLFITIGRLKYHEKFYHGKESTGSKCEVCEKEYKNPYVLRVHFNEHHRERKFKCEKCSEMFPFKSSLEKHSDKCYSETKQLKLKDEEYKVITDENSIKMYQCNRCKRKFQKVDPFYKHFSNVHKEQKQKCEKCNRLFPFESQLKKHLKRCDGIRKQIQVRQTLKGFDYDVIEDAASGKSYNCQRCEKKFKRVHSIVQHVHQKHRENNFKCDKCGRMFSFKSNLEPHMKLCDGVKKVKQKLKDFEYCVIENDNSDKQYQCNKCEQKFKTANTIRQHIFNMHKEKKFRCEICDKRFPFNFILNTHKKSCHENTPIKNHISSENVGYENDSESTQNVADRGEKVYANNFGDIEINIDDDVLEIYG